MATPRPVRSPGAVEAGWGNGSALSVPSAPPVGPQATTDNPRVRPGRRRSAQAGVRRDNPGAGPPGEGNCRYTFGALGTPGPDSLVFSIEFHQGGASLLSRPVPDGQNVDGVGDRAILIVRTEPGGPKALRPPSDVPVTVMSLMVARGQNMAIFTAQILISPTGPTAEQTKNQFITLVKGIDF